MRYWCISFLFLFSMLVVGQETTGNDSIHKPILDLDGDYFSSSHGFRGADWRGKDGDDFDDSTRPGRYDDVLGLVDNNCNGIFGWPSNGFQNYEQVLCESSQPRGVVIFGDSAAAAFSIPVEWLEKVGLRKDYGDFFDVLRKEFDWPQKSWATGFVDEIGGESIYMRLRSRNLCNHRDYQNLAVNGARSRHFVEQVGNLARKKDDKPVLAFVAYIGNDICKKSLDKMTTVEEYKRNMIAGLEALDQKLPAGSKVFCIGLVDGRILWDQLNDKQHPLGITYAELYSFLSNVVEKNPCQTWLTDNGEVRDKASARARELSKAMSDIVATKTYQNFDLAYMDFPLQPLFDKWVNAGNDPVDLIEPVDGFHPSHQLHRLMSKYVWEYLLKNYPSFIGPANEKNNEIRALFGTQSSH